MVLDLTEEEKQLLFDQFRGYLGAYALESYDNEVDLDTWPIELFGTDDHAHLLEMVTVQDILKKLVEAATRVDLTDREVTVSIDVLRGTLRAMLHTEEKILVPYELDDLPADAFDVCDDDEEDELRSIQRVIEKLKSLG